MDSLELDMELKYQKRLFEYNNYVSDLEIQRKEFYEKNPDFPFKNMFMNVCAPPLKIIIKHI